MEFHVVVRSSGFLTSGVHMDMTQAGLYGTVLKPSHQQPQPAPAPLPEPALKRLQDSEADAFAFFQSSFAELPWHRRGRPGIRRP